MSLSVSIVPLNRKKKFFTTSSLEESGGGGAQSIMLIAQSSMRIYATATFDHAWRYLGAGARQEPNIKSKRLSFCFVYLRNVFPIADTKASPV